MWDVKCMWWTKAKQAKAWSKVNIFVVLEMRKQIHGGFLLIFSANFKLRKSGPRGTQWWNQKQMVTSRRQQPPRTETCILPELCESWSQFPTYLRLKMVAMLVVDLMMNSLLIFSLLSSPWWRWWPCWWSSNLFWTPPLSSHRTHHIWQVFFWSILIYISDLLKSFTIHNSFTAVLFRVC